MKKLFLWADTLFKLGLLNVLRNIVYRLKLKSGYIIKLTPIKHSIKGTLFIQKDKNYQAESSDIIESEVADDTVKIADRLIEGNIRLFFYDEQFIGAPPNWFYHDEDKFMGHWSHSPVNKFLNKDIKLTWDISRFHWLQQLSCGYLVTGDQKYLNLLNSWFVDWNYYNPVNRGVNWACGQECSIRVVHVLNSTKILHDVSPNTEVLTNFVIEHAKRIEPTIDYAICQDNNHGTSEAAALFICGAWLLEQSNSGSQEALLASRWLDIGRKVLEERVGKLIMNDGGFSMYSTNYHRVVLNTLSVVEFWRKQLKQSAFSVSYISKCRAAVIWLYSLVDEISGDTLNLGANDGSNPFIVQSSDYRDYRPSIQFASVLFFNEKLYTDSCRINEPLLWLGIEHRSLRTRPKETSQLLSDSGIVILRSERVGELNSTGIIKYPNYQFRPNQADILHFDLWYEGVNILRDAGSYSYNCEPEITEYFSSMRAHNTVEIDHTEPMPRLGSFLLANWTKMISVSKINFSKTSLEWQGCYENPSRAKHKRKVEFSSGTWAITDSIVGAKDSIILRWHLKPGSWLLKDDRLRCANHYIKIQANVDVSIELTNQFESKYYNEKHEIPVLEIRTSGCLVIIKTYISLEGKS